MCCITHIINCPQSYKPLSALLCVVNCRIIEGLILPIYRLRLFKQLNSHPTLFEVVNERNKGRTPTMPQHLMMQGGEARKRKPETVRAGKVFQAGTAFPGFNLRQQNVTASTHETIKV